MSEVNSGVNRRGFLGGLAAFAAACALDPELALWKPGAKMISIPKPSVITIPAVSFSVGDVITIGGRFKIDPITGEATEELQRFMVAQAVEAQSRFDLLPIYPPCIPSGRYQNVAFVKGADFGKLRQQVDGYGNFKDLNCVVLG